MRASRGLAAQLLTVCVLTSLVACRSSSSREPDPEPAVPVIAEPVRLGDIKSSVSATGAVDAESGSEFLVIAPQPARIAEITKQVGDTVKSGEVLVRFEFPSLQAQTAVNAAAVKAADTRVERARLAQTRVRVLLSRGAASQREMDQADTDLVLAESELAAARAALTETEVQAQKTVVHAPFNGVVRQRLHDPGDMVRADATDPILRIADPKLVQVNAVLPAADITRFAVGARARAIAEGKSEPVPLRVVSRPQPEAGATHVTVVLAFEATTDLAPGTQLVVEIDADQHTDVPLVPAIAVLQEGDERLVFVAAGAVAQRRKIDIGLVDAQHIEIRSGVKPGELVITQGHRSLRDGAAISVSAP